MLKGHQRSSKLLLLSFQFTTILQGNTRTYISLHVCTVGLLAVARSPKLNGQTAVNSQRSLNLYSVTLWKLSILLLKEIELFTKMRKYDTLDDTTEANQHFNFMKV